MDKEKWQPGEKAKVIGVAGQGGLGCCGLLAEASPETLPLVLGAIEDVLKVAREAGEDQKDGGGGDGTGKHVGTSALLQAAAAPSNPSDPVALALFLEPHLSPSLLFLWRTHFNNPELQADILDVCMALIRSPGCAVPMQQRIIPLILHVMKQAVSSVASTTSSESSSSSSSPPPPAALPFASGAATSATSAIANTTMASSLPSSVLVSTLDLLKVVIDFAPMPLAPTSSLLSTFPLLTGLLQGQGELAKDHSVIQSGVECLKAFVRVVPSLLASLTLPSTSYAPSSSSISGSKSGAECVVGILVHLLSPSTPDSAILCIGGLFAQIWLRFGSPMGPALRFQLMTAVVRRLLTARLGSLQQSLCFAIGRAMIQDTREVVEMILSLTPQALGLPSSSTSTAVKGLETNPFRAQGCLSVAVEGREGGNGSPARKVARPIFVEVLELWLEQQPHFMGRYTVKVRRVPSDSSIFDFYF